MEIGPNSLKIADYQIKEEKIKIIISESILKLIQALSAINFFTLNLIFRFDLKAMKDLKAKVQSTFRYVMFILFRNKTPYNFTNYFSH